MKRKNNTDVIFNGFEWNKEKGNENFKKHKITFEEAATVFDDPFFIVFKDPQHSFREQRFIIIGLSDNLRYLFVSFAERASRARIISARELTAKERKDYENKRQKF
ncbi:MAG TPA: BrnT family toxin [Pyrinomonadaceae bacterium]